MVRPELTFRKDAPPRILVTRLRYLGDVILSTPVIDALNACFPHAEIWYMAESPYCRILDNHPGLAGVIEAGGTLATAARLRRLKFSAAVDLFYNPRSANILFLSGAPVRVGGGRRWRKRLYTDVFDPSGAAGGAVGHHLASLRPLGCEEGPGTTRIYLTDEERRAGTLEVAEAFGGLMPDRIVAFHPGGTWPAKRWDERSFAELIDLVSEEMGAKGLVLRGPGQEAITERVVSLCSSAPAALPVLPVREVSSAISACGALVANDGGILHASVALGMPTVGIFGPTDPDVWFPYSGTGPYEVVTGGAPCSPCDLHECGDMSCLEGVTTSQVARSLARVTGW